MITYGEEICLSGGAGGMNLETSFEIAVVWMCAVSKSPWVEGLVSSPPLEWWKLYKVVPTGMS